MNQHYRSPALAGYFAEHRRRWSEFYPSERWIFERVLAGAAGIRVLDVGCASGGLAAALAERYTIGSYAGVDINDDVIANARRSAQSLPMPTRFICGDIVGLRELPDEQFDLVVSLSCADWNTDTDAIIRACWNRVAAGGTLVISLRLSDQPGVNDVARSYQPIDATENANYVVFNVLEALRMFDDLIAGQGRLLGYGNWGTPSATAVTSYDRLVFAVFAVTRSAVVSPGIPSELHLPLDLFR